MGLLVNEDFVKGHEWSLANAQGEDYSSLKSYPPSLIGTLQNSTNVLERLETDDCLNQFSVPYVSRSSFLMVSSFRPDDYSIMAQWGNQAGDTTNVCWMCHPNFAQQCGVNYCNSYEKNQPWSIDYFGNGTIDDNGRHQISPVAEIDYCLADTVHEECKVMLSRTLLLVVIICNGLKLGCLGYLLLRSEWRPLITIGDAIADFLQQPDPKTAGAPYLYYVDCRRLRWQPSRGPELGQHRVYTRRWYSTTPRWFFAASLRRWILILTW